MKKYVMLAMGCLTMFLSGCGGINANLGVSGESFTNSRGENVSRKEWGSPGISFAGNQSNLPAVIRADADAYAIKKRADNDAAIIANMARGEMLKAGPTLKMLVVVNNHPRSNVWFYDPLRPGREIMVTPRGGMNFVEVNPSLKEFTLYVSNGEKFAVHLKPVKSPVVIAGINADYHVKYE